MAQSPSLEKLAGRFLNHLVGVRGYSVHTQNNYRLALGQFRAFLREHGEADVLASFTSDHVQEFITDLAGRGIVQSTLVLKLSALSSFADFLMKTRGERDKPYLATNPAKTFDWPTVEQPETAFMHREELQAFLELPLPMFEAVARDVLFDTGARVSEICRADVGDLVELDGGWSLGVTVKGRGTRKRKVFMPLKPTTVDALRAYLLARGIPSKNAEADRQQPLLLSVHKQRFTRAALSNLIERMGVDAGITRFRLSPHKIRHTVNVVRDLAGIDEFRRSRLLGQSSARSQERYRHIVQGGLREAKAQEAEGLAAYLGQGAQVQSGAH